MRRKIFYFVEILVLIIFIVLLIKLHNKGEKTDNTRYWKIPILNPTRDVIETINKREKFVRIFYETNPNTEVNGLFESYLKYFKKKGFYSEKGNRDYENNYSEYARESVKRVSMKNKKGSKVMISVVKSEIKSENNRNDGFFCVIITIEIKNITKNVILDISGDYFKGENKGIIKSENKLNDDTIKEGNYYPDKKPFSIILMPEKFYDYQINKGCKRIELENGSKLFGKIKTIITSSDIEKILIEKANNPYFEYKVRFVIKKDSEEKYYSFLSKNKGKTIAIIEKNKIVFDLFIPEDENTDFKKSFIPLKTKDVKKIVRNLGLIRR